MTEDRLRADDAIEVVLDKPRKLLLTMGDHRRWTRQFKDNPDGDDSVLTLVKMALRRYNPDTVDMDLDEIGDLIPLHRAREVFNRLTGELLGKEERRDVVPLPATEAIEEPATDGTTGSKSGPEPSSMSASIQTFSGN